MMKAGQSLALIKCKARRSLAMMKAGPSLAMMKAGPSLALIKAWPSQTNAECLKKHSPHFTTVCCFGQKMALHELTMLNQDCKSSKKGVTQKLKLHHEFAILDQDCIIHVLNIRL